MRPGLPRRLPLLTTLAFACMLASTAACTRGTPRSPPPPRAETAVRVENQSSFEMTIYVIRGAERRRLGTARPLTSTRLTLPAGLVFGSTSLRFQADPIGGRGTPISHEVLVSEGDEILLRIPPR